ALPICIPQFPAIGRHGMKNMVCILNQDETAPVAGTMYRWLTDSAGRQLKCPTQFRVGQRPIFLSGSVDGDLTCFRGFEVSYTRIPFQSRKVEVGGGDDGSKNQ